MSVQDTLMVIKPDAVQRRLIGKIIQRLEDKGLAIAAMKMVQLDRETAQQMYGVHEGKSFYQPLLKFMTASPIVAMIVRGPEAINVVRGMMGPTFGPDAPGGTIRGDFGISRRYNLVHGSDSPESAAREIPILFDQSEIIDYDFVDTPWMLADVDLD